MKMFEKVRRKMVFKLVLLQGLVESPPSLSSIEGKQRNSSIKEMDFPLL